MALRRPDPRGMRFTSRTATSLSILVLGAAGAGEAQAAAGDLDRTFGGDGKVLRSFGASDHATDVVVQRDRKILALISRERDGESAVAVARFLRSGRIDREFGRKGLARVSLSGDELAGGLALAPNQKPVVSFLSRPGAGERVVGIARFLRTGRPDETLDDDGVQTAGLGPDLNLTNVADVASLGGATIVGASAYPDAESDSEFVALKFQSAGELDEEFGEGGVVTIDVDGHDDIVHAVAVDEGALGVLLAGEASLGGSSCCVRRLAVVSLEEDGDPDVTFADGGTLIDGVSRAAQDVVRYPDGRIGVVGTVGGDFVAARYEENGDPDNSFSGDGRQVVDFADAPDQARRMILYGYDTMLVGTVSTARRGRDFGVAMLRKNGRLAERFSDDGKRAISVGGGEDEGLGIAISRKDEVIVGGAVERRGATDTGLIRLQGKSGRR